MRLVLVVAAPPDARLVARLGGSVEPLVHAPEAVQSARIRGIGVVDDAVVERERAHTRPLARVRRHVGPGTTRRPGPGHQTRDKHRASLTSTTSRTPTPDLSFGGLSAGDT